MYRFSRKIYSRLKFFLPIKVKRFIENLKLNSFKNESYSQFGEDLLIMRFFHKTKKVKYLDIGAFHPIKHSNTYKIHKYKYNGGTVVDIEKEKLNNFKKKRSNIEIICAAVVPNHFSKKILTMYNFDIMYSEIDTLDLKMALKQKNQRNINFRSNKINTIKINELLKKDNFDFLNIDIEGLDIEVINSIDFKYIYKPRLIVFESHEGLNKVENLEKNGYKLLFFMGKSIAYYLDQKE